MKFLKFRIKLKMVQEFLTMFYVGFQFCCERLCVMLKQRIVQIIYFFYVLCSEMS